MKKKKTKPVKSAKRFPRPPVIITAIAVMAIAAITVVSRQLANGTETSAPQKVTTATAANNKYMKMKVAGQDVLVDPQTGQIKRLSPEEARKLADGLKGMLNKSTEGLVEEHNPDGSVTVDLQDRFQNVTVARVNEDGTVSQSCVDNPRAAGAFFGVDPEMLKPEKTSLPVRTPPQNR